MEKVFGGWFAKGGAWAAALTALVAALVSAGCGSAPRPGGGDGGGGRTPGAAPRKMLTYAVANDLSNLDPALMNDVESALVGAQVYQGLVKFKADSVDLEPDLAERWETSADGLTWTFHLKPGARFSDGAPVDADAAVFSVMRQMDPKHPAHRTKMYYANFLFGDRSTTETTLVSDVRSSGPLTVVFTLARRHVPFAANLAMTPAAIVSPKAVLAMKDDFNTTMVGSGPFLLASYRRDDLAVLTRNPGFAGPRPALDEVRVRILRDPSVRVSALKKGDVDAITGVEPAAVPGLKSDPRLRVLTEPSMNLGYLALNNARKPFDDPRVRLALCYAIDRTAIVDGLFAGGAVVARGILPPGMAGHDPGREAFAHDIPRAKALLAEAGYPGGFDVTLTTHDKPRLYYPVGAKLAERIQADLAAAGVRVKIDLMEFPTFLEKVKAKDFTMANTGWVTDNGDPDNFIYELVGRPDNDSQYRNADQARAMREAAGEPDPAKRAALYRAVETEVLKTPPFVPINHANQTMALRTRVLNLRLHPTGITQFAGADVAAAPAPAAPAPAAAAAPAPKPR